MSATTRLENLSKLLDEYQSDIDDYDEDCEEDLRPYFTGEQAPKRFACVTLNEGKHFFLLLNSFKAAKLRALEYMVDDIWPELAVAVVDLDTGAATYPQWEQTSWSDMPSREGSQFRT